MMKRCIKEKACFLLIGFFSFIIHPVLCQDQKLADSLTIIYKEGNLNDTAKMELLWQLSFNETRELKLGLKYADELIMLSRQKGSDLYLFRGYQLKGYKKRLMGDLDEALDAYFKSVGISPKLNYPIGEANSYLAIADIYAASRNHPNAMHYYHKAIGIFRQSHDSVPLAAALTNAGGEYLDNKKYDSALLYFRESTIISEKTEYLIGKAYNLGNLGILYAERGESDLAEKNINEAIGILEENEVYDPICSYLLAMSEIYLEKGNAKMALNEAVRSLKLAEQYGLKDQISEASLKVSGLYDTIGKPNEAFKYYKNHILYRDSVNDIASVQKMADVRTDFEVSRKQVEVDLLNQQKRNQRNVLISLSVILGLGVILLSTLYWYYKNISREKKRSESLLLNILPAETAKELKQHGKVEAVKFDQVTVLFTDFVQFTKVAEQADPEQLVKSIDYYFKGFDEITTKYGLEKIKTVGDSYMCACGLPTLNPSHASNVIKAAKEMVELVKNELNATDGLSHFEVRVGIHTGPVVAGIVGIKKWQYDIWGDTVNIASRMESKSEPGRINLSETTYNEIKDEFPCEYRGEIEVKHRGMMKMYFLSRSF